MFSVQPTPPLTASARPLAEPLPLLQREAVQAAIATHATRPGALLPLLHEVQDRLGYVPPAAVPLIAAGLNLSRAEVHGVVTFYHHFRNTPPGRHVLRLCRAEACQAVGALALERQLKQRLHVDYHGTSADGAVTLEPVYCLGNCAAGPSLMLDDAVHGRVDAAALEALLQSCEAAA